MLSCIRAHNLHLLHGAYPSPCARTSPPHFSVSLRANVICSGATWDQQLDSVLHACDENKCEELECSSPSSSSSPLLNCKNQSLLSRLIRYTTETLSGRHKNRPLLSDLIWSFGCCFLGIIALGVLDAHSSSLPGVLGHWHSKGLPVLLGSFGTLCVLIFARPESEPIKVWNLFIGEILSVSIALVVLRCLEVLSAPLIVSRALAMSLAVVGMMWTDSVHPPGGALVLVASDNSAAASIGGWLALYPGLALTVLILLPLGLACNFLKSKCRFDFPESPPKALDASGSQQQGFGLQTS
jgi:hypothetical protein